MAYTKYSLTPANNNAAPPDGAPEGMLPSAVNDTMRDMMAQIRDVGDGIRGGTYTMTAPVITGGSITGVALSGNTLTNPVITGGSINNTPIGASTANTGKFTTLTNAALTSGRVTYAGTSGVLQDDADFTFNGTTVTMANDASISGLTVGKGGGGVASNVVLGAGALASNLAGLGNTAIGQSSLTANTANTNTAVGYQTGLNNTTGFYNIYVGYTAGLLNTTGASNTVVGTQGLRSNTTGGYNTAVGDTALYSNTTASNNTAVGYQAGYSNTTGLYNSFVGSSAGFSNTTGGTNTMIGRNAGYSNSTGTANVIIGHEAGYFCTGSSNTFVGGGIPGVQGGAGVLMTTGNKNTILGNFTGNQGGLDIRTASNHIVLSDGDGNPVGYWDNNRIFNSGLGTTGNTLDGIVYLKGSNAAGYGPCIRGFANNSTNWYVGNYSYIVGGSSQFLTCANTSGGVYLNGASATSWTAVSDETRKVIIEPITDAANKVSTLRAVIGRLKTDTEDVRRPYLIAQDVQKVLPEAVSEAEDKEGAVLGLSYTEVIPLLVAAITELNAKVEAQALEIAQLKGN
jgi:hypothetical protein